MASEGARDATRDATLGFFLLLAAAFILLAGFVFLIGAVLRPSVARLGLAVGVLLVGGLGVRTGYAAFQRAAGDGTIPPQAEATGTLKAEEDDPERPEAGPHGRSGNGP